MRGAPLDVGADALPAPPAAPGPLPVPLGSYERKHLRFPVDWMATLDLGTGATAVRVRDVSQSGVGIETTLPLRVGDRAVLHLDQLADQPALSVIVKNVVAPLGRVGLGFVAAGSTAARVVALAKKTDRLTDRRTRGRLAVCTSAGSLHWPWSAPRSPRPRGVGAAPPPFPPTAART